MKTRTLNPEDRFREAYARLAERSKCDAPGGMEYKRVLREWLTMGRPSDIESFIAIRANVLWDGSSRAEEN